jgi:predicted ATPase
MDMNYEPPPRIEYLRVKNYRSLRELVLLDLTPLTVLLGPNGSGKSTVLDVFSFLAECFQFGLRHAWERRGRARELKSRGQDGAIWIELGYRERPDDQLLQYALEFDEKDGGPEVTSEHLVLRSTASEDQTVLLYKKGVDSTGGSLAKAAPGVSLSLRSPDLIAVNALGQLADHPRVAALREFITDWHVSCLSLTDTRGHPGAGPQERLSQTGGNLANVVQYLADKEPERLAEIARKLSHGVPLLEKVMVEELADGRLSLRIKDMPFREPIPARFASDGSIKILAFLSLLGGPRPPRFIGIEEPENFLHPRLMYSLAEEFRAASAHSQLLVTTHSPYFLDALRPDEARVLFRGESGYTQAVRASDIDDVREFMADGGSLGDLWMEGHFHVGDPLTNSGMPVRRARN